MKTALQYADRMLTEHEAAAILNVKVSTLRAWRVKGSPIPFLRIGRNIRYSLETIQRYLSTVECHSTSEAGRS